MADLSGTTLGKYQVIERLGRGGMAEVYRAHQASMDRFVALKVMHAHLAEDEGFTERFRREARAVGSLRHPNIVQVIDFDIQDDTYYMVMEYIHGETLKAMLQKRGALPVPQALDIAAKLADALAYAHKEKMLHRDIKPANVMFSKTGEPVLTDFGVAKILGATHLTASGAVVGTPAYMSPEAGRGEVVDERTDIYSLGIVLFEMLTGTVPYDADTPYAIIYKHISDPLPTPRKFIADLPESVEQIVFKALAKNREDRYLSAEAFRDALNAVRQKLPSEMPTPPVRATPKPVVASPDVGTFVEAEGRQRGLTLPLTLIVGAVVLVAIVVVAAVLIGSGSGTGGGPTDEQNTRTAVALDIGREPATAATPTDSGALAGTTVPSRTDIPTDTVAPIAVPPTTLPTNTTAPTTPVPPTLPPTETQAPPATETPTEVLPTRTPAPTEAGTAVAVQPPGVLYAELTAQIREQVRNGLLDAALHTVEVALSSDPESYDLLVLHGFVLVQYRSEGEKLEAGKASAEKAVAIDPERPEAYVVLGFYYQYFPFDDPVTAIDYYTRAIARGSTDPLAFLQRAIARESTDASPDEVLADYNRALELAPESLNAHERRGAYLYYTLGRYAEAEADFARAIALNPGDMTSYHLLASAYLLQGKRQEAYDLYARVVAETNTVDIFTLSRAAYAAWAGGLADQASEWADLALLIEPKTFAASYVLALLAWDAGAYERALAQLDEIAAAGDRYEYGWPFLNPLHNREVHTDRARLLAAMGSLEEALQAYGQAIRAEYWTVPYIERSRLYRQLGKLDEARADLRQALEINRGTDNDAERSLILAELQAIQADATVEPASPPPTLQAVLPFVPPTPTLMPTATPPDPTRLAMIQPDSRYVELTAQVRQKLRDGLAESALSDVTAALEADPQSYDLLALHGLALMWLSANNEQLETGKASAEAALALDPERPEAYLVLGLYYDDYRIGDRNRALEYYALAVEKGSQDPLTFFRRANINRYRGDVPRAQVLADYTQAVSLEPQNSYFLYERGTFYLYYLRAYASAQADLEEALRLSSDRGVHSDLAVAYLLNNRGESAYALYAGEIEEQKNTDSAYLAEGALVARQTGNAEKASAWAELALLLEPGTTAATYAQALLAQDNQQYEEALGLMEVVLQVDYGSYAWPFLTWMFDRHPMVDRARILAALGRADAAIESYTEASQTIEWARPLIELAQLHIQRGELELARRSLQRGLEISQWMRHEAERAEILAQLAQLRIMEATAAPSN